VKQINILLVVRCVVASATPHPASARHPVLIASQLTCTQRARSHRGRWANRSAGAGRAVHSSIGLRAPPTRRGAGRLSPRALVPALFAPRPGPSSPGSPLSSAGGEFAAVIGSLRAPRGLLALSERRVSRCPRGARNADGARSVNTRSGRTSTWDCTAISRRLIGRVQGLGSAHGARSRASDSEIPRRAATRCWRREGDMRGFCSRKGLRCRSAEGDPRPPVRHVPGRPSIWRRESGDARAAIGFPGGCTRSPVAEREIDRELVPHAGRLDHQRPLSRLMRLRPNCCALARYTSREEVAAVFRRAGRWTPPSTRKIACPASPCEGIQAVCVYRKLHTVKADGPVGHRAAQPGIGDLRRRIGGCRRRRAAARARSARHASTRADMAAGSWSRQPSSRGHRASGRLQRIGLTRIVMACRLAS